MAKFATVEEAIDEIRNGNMIIVVDDEDRENEGDIHCMLHSSRSIPSR